MRHALRWLQHAVIVGIALFAISHAKAHEYDVAAVVCSPEFSWNCEWALATTWCESNWQADAVNLAGPYNGWWQVWRGSLDPYENTRQAHQQFVEWQYGLRNNPWPNCPRG